MKPIRKAISSGHAIFIPWRSSRVWTKVAASIREKGSGIQPCKTASHFLDGEGAGAEIAEVDVSDLKLAAP